NNVSYQAPFPPFRFLIEGDNYLDRGGSRQSGPTRFIQLHWEIADSLPLRQAHMLAEQVEKWLRHRFPGANIITTQTPVPWCQQDVRGIRRGNQLKAPHPMSD
ncbi:MAG: hypothetical protein G5701_10170, partial [Serratia symbiotica]|nr:hypothetical protein [Serratia symbiotica]